MSLLRWSNMGPGTSNLSPKSGDGGEMSLRKAPKATQEGSMVPWADSLMPTQFLYKTKRSWLSRLPSVYSLSPTPALSVFCLLQQPLEVSDSFNVGRFLCRVHKGRQACWPQTAQSQQQATLFYTHRNAIFKNPMLILSPDLTTSSVILFHVICAPNAKNYTEWQYFWHGQVLILKSNIKIHLLKTKLH